MTYHDLYQQKMENMKQAYEKEFQGHEATYQVYDERLAVLDWKKPNTTSFAIRYVFDGQYLYVSGDLGSATFRLTWQGNPNSFKQVGLGYFMEKRESSQYHSHDFCRELLGAELDEKFSEWLDEQSASGAHDPEELALIQSTISELKQSDNARELIEKLQDLDTLEHLSLLDSDAWEWAYDLGHHPDGRLVAYLLGLQLAATQLAQA